MCHGCILKDLQVQYDCSLNATMMDDEALLKDSLEAVGPRFFAWCEMLLGFYVGNHRFKIYTPSITK